MQAKVLRSSTMQRDRKLSRRTRTRVVFHFALYRLSKRRRLVSKISHRLDRWTALCVSSRDLRSLGHLVYQRGDGGELRQAPRRGGIHADVRFRFCAATSRGACRFVEAHRARLFHRRLCRNQRRIVVDLRGRQHGDRSRHGSAGYFPVQGAANAKSVRCFRCDVTPSLGASLRGGGVTSRRPSNLRRSGLAKRSTRRTGTSARASSSHAR